MYVCMMYETMYMHVQVGVHACVCMCALKKLAHYAQSQSTLYSSFASGALCSFWQQASNVFFTALKKYLTKDTGRKTVGRGCGLITL